ncbi:translation initiation factor SUI1 [Malaciobacter canalis]|uniref:Translation initiation factor SUI1 n=1 Tax=Malaciobacter canalis TaxID=1912871 RepID=A0ABX4LML5_9BACT|nr:translation initiation factor SUI1 [Malaciobacter canalis]PHO09109.1 translation initiation factor SUI1 [Malaciobacter canalis]QEE31787.1 eIF1/SUI1 family translation initiation factor [Malaciobacter canalis]
MIFEMGAKLEGDNFDTKKEDKKKNSKQTIESKNKHQLVFTFEKRKGKPVTLVGRFYLIDKDKKEILKLLKKKLACGGSIKEEWIELQGDVKIKVKEILQKEGWKFK